MSQEKAQRKVVLTDQDPFVTQALVYYAYKGDYDDQSGNDPSREAPIIFNCRIYALATEYQMQKLKNLAVSKIGDFSYKSFGKRFKKEDFCTALSVIYESTPQSDRGLRDVGAKMATNRYRQLKGEERFQNMLETSRLGADIIAIMDKRAKTLAEARTAKEEKDKDYKCPVCSEVSKLDPSRLAPKTRPVSCWCCSTAHPAGYWLRDDIAYDDW